MTDSFNGKDRALLVETATKVANMEKQISNLVTKDAFKPVAWIVYGMAATILSGFLIALVKWSPL